MSGFWDDAEVISEYSRRQAIEDGMLVALADELEALAGEAGFRCQVALTRPLFALIEPTDAEKERGGQSLTGRLWDVLYMARTYLRRAREAAAADEPVDVVFPCIFWVAGRPEYQDGSSPTRQLWFSLGPGDAGEAVVTIGFPEDR